MTTGRAAMQRTCAAIGMAVLLAANACTAASDANHSVAAPPVATDGPCCGPITPDGQRVLRALDTSNVEHLWLKSTHVAWDTGEPDLSAADEEAFARIDHRDTHCSAFAAAMGQRLGVYMLRPPEHGQKLLATAQANWFTSRAGREAGWRPLDEAAQAQTLANSGQLVVVVYASPNPHRPGHIAIVRPDDGVTLEQLRDNGPRITQAGGRNYLSTTVRQGFHAHPDAWPDGVKYFAHDLPAPSN
jgi:hypothetical protein